MVISDDKIITHDFPARRAEANFIIGALLEEKISDIAQMEQIWAKQIEEDLFSICCIPFFTYGLALGYKVQTKPIGNMPYVIERVIEKSTNVTYRVFFQNTNRWSNVIDDISQLGCTVEPRWKNSNVIGVDAPDDEKKVLLEGFLLDLVKQKDISCEYGM